jgi:hypothetical protein
MVDLNTRPAPTAFSERTGLLMVRYMESLNVNLFHLSKGRVGGSIFGQPVILLTTPGRRTGVRRTKPLLALPDGDAWIVAGSRGGNSRHPDWYENLLVFEQRASLGTLDDEPVLKPPTIELVGGKKVPVSSQVLQGEERAAWWRNLVAVYPRFDSYQRRLPHREIPVVRLTPAPH